MNYEMLSKIYYTDYEKYETLYKARFNAPFAKHIDFSIKEYHHEKSFPAFYNYTESIVLLQEKIYKSYESFLRVFNGVPFVVLHQFSLTCLLDEVKSTNDIEGVQSTRKEIRNIIDGNPESPRLKSIVTKYQNLLAKHPLKFQTAEDIRAFYDDFAHTEISAENPQNKLDGRLFRKDSVDITSGTGKTIHRGVFPETEIISALNQALSILNDDTIPFLIRLGIFHYLFAYIHPFYDGNGRTDRFITAYYIAHHFNENIALRLSVSIKKNRSQYYRLFADTNSEINRADLTPFIEGFLNFILQTFDDTTSLLKRKKEQLEKYKKIIDELQLKDDTTKNIYYILLQAALFYGRGVSIKDLELISKKARGTVQRRLDNMPKEHLLVSKGGRKLYYKLNLSIFK